MKKLGIVTLDHMMRVHQLDVGGHLYSFSGLPVLNAGHYEVWADGSKVEFVKVGDPGLDAEDQALLKNLMERSEHN